MRNPIRPDGVFGEHGQLPRQIAKGRTEVVDGIANEQSGTRSTDASKSIPSAWWPRLLICRMGLFDNHRTEGNAPSDYESVNPSDCLIHCRVRQDRAVY
jgi:hypothetical protein